MFGGDEVFIPEPVSQVLHLYDGPADESAWHRTAKEQIEKLAARLRQGHRTKVPGAALETVSRAHGFSSWRSVASDGGQGDPAFERAVEDLLAGTIPALVGSRERFPDLVVRRSHYGHRARLLHYLAANGVETYRQRVPRSASKIARLLLERGADPLATANMYGGNRTTKGMLISSAHPAAAGLTDAILAVLDGTSGVA